MLGLNCYLCPWVVPDAVEVFGEGLDVGVGQGRGRHGSHPRGITSAKDDGPNQLALLIVENELRTEQIRTARVATTQVGAVAKPAVGFIQRLSSCDEFGITGCALLGRAPEARPDPRGGWPQE